MTEPMTDAELAGLAERSKRLAEYYDSISLPARDMGRLLARLDAERTRADAAESARDRHMDEAGELHGQTITLMLQLADAKRGLAKAESARDAALARAMPEPRLPRTVEEVHALPEGLYLQVMPDGGWVIREKEDAVHWTMRPALGRALVGPIRLPDLPIPTPGDADNG